MLKRIWIWLCRERTRQTLAFLGGGLVVVVSGLWTYFHGSTDENTLFQWSRRNRQRRSRVLR